MSKKDHQNKGIRIKIGKQARRILFDHNSICELEEVLDRPVSDFGLGMEQGPDGQAREIPKGKPGYVAPQNRIRPSFKLTRALLWAGLLHDPAFDGLTLKDAGELVDQVQGDDGTSRFAAVTEKVMEAFSLYMSAETSQKKAKEPEPTEAETAVDDSGN